MRRARLKPENPDTSLRRQQTTCGSWLILYWLNAEAMAGLPFGRFSRSATGLLQPLEHIFAQVPGVLQLFDLLQQRP